MIRALWRLLTRRETHLPRGRRVARTPEQAAHDILFHGDVWIEIDRDEHR